MSKLMSDGGDCRTALATPGLLITEDKSLNYSSTPKIVKYVIMIIYELYDYMSSVVECSSTE